MKNNLFPQMLGIGAVVGLGFSAFANHFAIWQLTVLAGIITAAGINTLLRVTAKRH